MKESGRKPVQAVSGNGSPTPRLHAAGTAPRRLFALTARSKHEPHRVATTLELMFDLASVIAVSAAASGLHHGITHGHALEALPSFLFAFFMIWWSWMNYSWFASAYDDGSAPFRILSLLTMFGALAIAAGIPAVFAHQPIHLCLLGFVVMRVGMALFWFGAAAGDPPHRKTALTYGFGILLLQAYWIWFVFAIGPASGAYVPLITAGILGEISVPALAEFRHGPTTWHRHHIMERYGLLTIIMLGECFVSIAAMLAADDAGTPANLHGMLSAITSAAITFSMWALYFTREEHLETEELRRAIQWGYGHFALFAAVAATGAGFAVFHEVSTGKAAVNYQVASYAIAIPVAVYLLTLWLVRDRFCLSGWRSALLPAAALLVFASPYVFGEALLEITLLTMATAAARRLCSPAR